MIALGPPVLSGAADAELAAQSRFPSQSRYPLAANYETVAFGNCVDEGTPMHRLAFGLAAFAFVALVAAVKAADAETFLLALTAAACGYTTWRARRISSFLKILVGFFSVETILFGIAVLVSVLGFWPKASLKPLERLYPVMWTGFWINAITGTVLLLADATTKVPSVVFWTKMAFVFAGVWVLIVIRKRIFGDPVLTSGILPPGTKRLAYVSLICWLGAIEAGRLLAYLGPVSGLTGISNH